MAQERVTLGDIRAVAKVADGIRFGGWTPGDPNNPLPDELQEMADDITSWFNPDQGWHLTEVRAGIISPQRMADSVTEDSVVKFRARVQQPDQFTPVFQFQAERPPMIRTRVGIVRKDLALNLKQVFAPKFKARVGYIGDFGGGPQSMDIMPEKVGPVYPLEQALKEVSSPYYLRAVNISVAGGNEHAEYLHALQFAHLKDQPKPVYPGPMKNLNVMLYTADLVDYTRLEGNRLRRAQRKLDKKFPPLQSALEAPAQ